LGGLIVGLILFGVGVAPTAVVGAVWYAQWQRLGDVLLLLFLTFGARTLGMKAAQMAK